MAGKDRKWTKPEVISIFMAHLEEYQKISKISDKVWKMGFQVENYKFENVNIAQLEFAIIDSVVNFPKMKSCWKWSHLEDGNIFSEKLKKLAVVVCQENWFLVWQIFENIFL